MSRNLMLAGLTAAAVVACGQPALYWESTEEDPPELTPDAGAPMPDPSPAATGLPCEVAQVLADHCLSCHGPTLSGGATVRLATRTQLLDQAASDPSKTNAQVSLERMANAARPMPPGQLVAAAERAILERWVSAGAPAEVCGDVPVDPPPEPELPDHGRTCTSGTTWRGGNEGSSRMYPGRACLACHASEGEGPRGVAGTVFPSLHEPDDCNGQDAITVELTDATGKVIALRTNAAGNFSSSSALRMPATVRILSGSAVRVMKSPITTSDCNACHTRDGDGGAPGRIVAP